MIQANQAEAVLKNAQLEYESSERPKRANGLGSIILAIV